MLKMSRFASLAVVVVMALVAVSPVAQAQDSWTGEVVEKVCFVEHGMRGADHAECAQSCFERGGDVGLFTDDGTLVILKAHPDAGAAFEMLKELAGGRATVTGELAEQDGEKIVTVTAATAAE